MYVLLTLTLTLTLKSTVYVLLTLTLTLKSTVDVLLTLTLTLTLTLKSTVYVPFFPLSHSEWDGRIRHGSHHVDERHISYYGFEQLRVQVDLKLGGVYRYERGMRGV